MLLGATHWSDDATLLSGLRTDHPGALDALVCRYRSRIQRHAARFVRSAADAEDLAQDVLVKVWCHARRLDDHAQLWPWIARITANAALSHLRSERRRGAREASWAPRTASDSTALVEPADREALADQQVLLAQLHHSVAAAVGALPPAYRMAILLRDLRECTTEETSRSLGIPVPTVKSRVHRGRRLLKRSLGHFGPARAMGHHGGASEGHRS